MRSDDDENDDDVAAMRIAMVMQMPMLLTVLISMMHDEG